MLVVVNLAVGVAGVAVSNHIRDSHVISRWKRAFVLAFAILLVPTLAHAWNYTGHRVIASIAYRQLDDQARQRIAEVLKHHPASADLWSKREANGPDDVLNLFWNAAVFPDEARSAPWNKYSRPKAHYVNYRIRAEDADKIEPPVKGENILTSYAAHLKAFRKRGASMEDKALHLSWVFHQVGDVHQPLHTVARFSKALPEGDRGGNEVRFPRVDGRNSGSGGNLHSYWDNIVGADTQPAAVEKLAEELMKEYPRDGFSAELKKQMMRDWAEESVRVAVETAYKNLDPEITEFSDVPVGYRADATRAARRRMALAGYRLAEELKRLFAE